MKFLILLTLLGSSSVFASQINHFTVEISRDDSGAIRNGCRKAKNDSAQAALKACYSAGYQECELQNLIKVGYYKRGIWHQGLCKYKAFVQGLDDLENDKFLFTFSGTSSFGSCSDLEVNKSLTDFTESNVMTECLLKYESCSIVITRLIANSSFDCSMESIARGAK